MYSTWWAALSPSARHLIRYAEQLVETCVAPNQMSGFNEFLDSLLATEYDYHGLSGSSYTSRV